LPEIEERAAGTFVGRARKRANMLALRYGFSLALIFTSGTLGCVAGPDALLDVEGNDEQVATAESALISDRSVMVSRAQRWVTLGIPYNQASYFEGYRQDCSGLVSMAWDLGTSAVTSTLRNYATYIYKDQLQPGDVINNQGIGNAGHVVLFKQWLNADRTLFKALEENGGAGRAVETTRTLVRKGAGWTISEYDASAPGPYVFQRSNVASSIPCSNVNREAGWVLTPGQSLSVCNGKARLSLQWDGNLVLYNSGSTPLWTSNTAGRSAKHLVMQYDGNLVLYDTSNMAIWTSNTNGKPGAFFALQTDANMVIYYQGAAVWSSGTSVP
jgi:hypothetical protein